MRIFFLSVYIESSTYMYTPFKSDLINDMDHMRILGNVIHVIRRLVNKYRNWFP